PFDRSMLDFLIADVRGDLTARFNAARQAADIAPQSTLAVVELPESALELNLPGRAVDLLSRIDPDRGQARGDPGYWVVLAFALHMLGDYERQLEVVKELRQRYPDVHSALSLQARALAALGRTTELNRVLDEVMLIPPAPEYGAVGLLYHLIAADELLAH